MTKESGMTKRYITEGFIETREDVKLLPKNLIPGSTFVCMTDLSVWVLDSKQNWVEIGGKT